jgi:hypothetical protein
MWRIIWGEEVQKPKKRMEDNFIAPARRAFRRVARQVRAENAKLGLPLVLGDNGHLRLVRVR